MIPLALAGCWFAVELAPFVPSLDFQLFKDSIRPLWQSPGFEFSGFFRAFVAWMVVAWLAASFVSRGSLPFLLAVAMAGVVAAKIVIVNNVVTLTDVAALAAGYVGALAMAGRGDRQAGILLRLLAASIAISAFAPFTLTETQTFHWVPFAGSLGGSMLINAKVIAGKIFAVGSIYFLAMHSGVPIRRAMVPVAAALLAIEIAQVWVGGHTAEITDPILALVVGYVFSALDKRDAAQRPGQTVAAEAMQAVRADDARGYGAERREAPASGYPTEDRPEDGTEDGEKDREEDWRDGRGSPLDRDLLVPGRRGTIALVLACSVIAYAMSAALGLPGVPYNLRELFGGSNAWWRLFFFAAAIFSFGIGGTMAGHRTARSGAPWTSLPVSATLACFATYLLLSVCVTSESMDDITGSSNTWYYVTERNLWGETVASLFRTVLWEGIVAAVERVVRFVALLGPLFLWTAVVTGVYFRTTDPDLPSAGARVRTFLACGAGYVLCALPWLYVFPIIAFNHSSTDNLNELIQDNGAWLYPLLILFPLNMVAVAHATSVRGGRAVVRALFFVAVSLPVGWYLFRSGLSAPVEKYGLKFTGADFLLGPDRKELLPGWVLVMRYTALQLGAVAALAFGMRVLLTRRTHAAREDMAVDSTADSTGLDGGFDNRGISRDHRK